jgi:hypothetical protein
MSALNQKINPYLAIFLVLLTALVLAMLIIASASQYNITIDNQALIIKQE